MVKLARYGFKFPETPSNINLCTVVYNAYYSDSQLRWCLENRSEYKHSTGNHRELNVHIYLGTDIITITSVTKNLIRH